MSKGLVVLTWEDAWSDNDETKFSDWKSDCIVKTAGWLINCSHEDCQVVHIASERFPDEKGYFRDVTHIPRGMIRKLASYGKT